MLRRLPNPWQSGSHDLASKSDGFITHLYHGCLGRIFQLNPRQLVSTCGSCAGFSGHPVTYGNASGSIIQYGSSSTKQESCHQSLSSAQICALRCFLGDIFHSQQNSFWRYLLRQAHNSCNLGTTGLDNDDPLYIPNFMPPMDFILASCVESITLERISPYAPKFLAEPLRPSSNLSSFSRSSSYPHVTKSLDPKNVNNLVQPNPPRVRKGYIDQVPLFPRSYCTYYITFAQ
jgi:hypothetical protein